MIGRAVLQKTQAEPQDQEIHESDRKRRANSGECGDHHLLPCAVIRNELKLEWTIYEFLQIFGVSLMDKPRYAGTVLEVRDEHSRYSDHTFLTAYLAK